jgi:signal transduction histidine kinase
MTATERQRRLEDFGQALALEREPVALRRLIMSRLQELCGCDGAVFCDRAETRDEFAATQVSGRATKLPHPPTFAGHGPLVRWLRANEEPLLVPDHRSVLDYLPSAERDVLLTANVRVCLPLVSANRVVAIALLSAFETPSPAPAWEPDFLNTCGRQAAVACDRVRREQEERAQLEAASRAQQLAVAGQLAAAMAHEVRNPLTAIRSSVQYVMESEAQWPGKVDLLRQVLDEVDRINRTISGVLGLGRTSNVAFTSVDLVSIVEQTLVLFTPYFDHRHLVVDRRMAPEPITINGETGEIRQVLLNVLLNACQATADGGRITIGVATNALVDGVDGDGRRVLVSIADSGSGMTETQLARVFEPFFTTKETGTGLGLPICRQIMTRHGGDIRLESAFGRGTTAVLSWPLADA